jgi:hypothetical protein
MNSGKAVILLSLLLAVVLLIRCGNAGNDQAKTDVALGNPNDIVKGKALAAQYCQSCHQLPAPSLLDKITWKKYVLPVMGLYLGVKYHTPDSVLINQSGDMSFLPQKPVIDSLQWQQIVNYYVDKAPQHLPVAERVEPIKDLPGFKIITAPKEWVSSRVLTSYVKIDESVKPHRILVCDGMNNNVIVLNAQVRTMNSSRMSSAIVDMAFQGGDIIATAIGDDLWANNARKGTVKKISLDKSGKVAVQEELILDKLSRPVATQLADWNMDGKPDYLVAQFGKMTGRLSWFEELAGSKKEHIVRDKPGCVKTIVDGHNLWALFAQGDEGLFQYINDGKGNFKEKRILSFPPSYGSTYFDLIDFNGDGLKDIIYTSGDNGDYSQIPKPYHGIYIYINKGNDTYANKYFYPMNGCYKAIAKDFDGDNKLDIAAISEFPGDANHRESFIFLKGLSDLKFKAHTLPSGIAFTSATTMDAGDIDGDGKTDLLLGNGFVDPNDDKANKQPLFIVLKNISSIK